MILESHGVTKAFGGLMALYGVDLSIREGELKCIIGPNGAGKTTLFHVINGYHTLDSGKIIFKGEDITNYPPRRICAKGIGRAFQVTNIFPRLTAYENVRAALLSKHGKTFSLFTPAARLVREETLEVLDTVGLSDVAHSVSGSLSRGDQKRLDIAIAVAYGSDLLLLEEPTAGMSPEETVSITELIRALNQEKGITILFTEHDTDVVFAISERIAVMHVGSIIAEGKPEEVRANEQVQRIYFGTE
jgi:branched-chain amino acid transport system ATP-binding protein